MHVPTVVAEIEKMLREVENGASRTVVEREGLAIKVYKVGEVVRIDIKQPK